MNTRPSVSNAGRQSINEEPDTLTGDPIAESLGFPVSGLDAFGLTKSLQEIITQDRETATNFTKINVQGLPLRAYLDQTVIPVLIEGLKFVAKERFKLLFLVDTHSIL